MLEEIVPWTLVSLFTNPTNVVPKVEEPVPPFATGRTPVTLEARLIWLAVICWPERDR